MFSVDEKIASLAMEHEFVVVTLEEAKNKDLKSSIGIRTRSLTFQVILQSRKRQNNQLLKSAILMYCEPI